MKKTSGITHILFWSVISAAFIGPGTITTATAAGARFDYALIWAVLFSTIACLLLQEASARLTIHSGYSLGEAISQKFAVKRRNYLIPLLVAGAIFIGGIAYQVGNILGAIGGASQLIQMDKTSLTLSIVISGGLVLWLGNTKWIANLLGVIVALMGVAFFIVALTLPHDSSLLTMGTCIPSIPQGSGLLVVGLIGTTIVPYNLFLGSGISKGQSIKTMRTGISVAILLGGLITVSVVLVGTSLPADFEFKTIGDLLNKQVGNWGKILFGTGLFAAGFTSSVTAPFAASITAKSLFEPLMPGKWEQKSILFRMIWISILLSGLLFALLDIKPIPAILLAQVANGLLLPFVSIFLLIVINDPNIMPTGKRNPRWNNILLGLLVLITLGIGTKNVVQAILKVLTPELL